MVMKRNLELGQGQTQNLVMTPQLQQAIKLLHMNNLELTEFVVAELERNPLLENSDTMVERYADDASGSGREATSAIEDSAAKDGSSKQDVATVLGKNGNGAANIEQSDASLESVYADEARADKASREAAEGVQAGWSSTGQGSSTPLGEGFNLEAVLSSEKTLNDLLTEQLYLEISDPIKRLIGAHLIGSLNRSGYLTQELDQIADTLGADVKVVKEVHSTVQKFDPTGVFSRDLRECLTIQLKEKNRLDPVMQKLLDNLELLAKHDYAALMKLLDADSEDIHEMISDIHGCNPRPASEYDNGVVQPVVPDVYVREGDDGSWHVELNSQTLPRVLVNNQYYAHVAQSATNEEDKLFLNNCLNDANWLVKNLDQRAQTILKVSREIVRQQRAFLIHGVQHLKPMKLKEVADKIGMHESTVSRVTSNKYMYISRGTFELKYFFTTALASNADGDAHSAESVRQRIREMIDDEDSKSILSDDRIAELLNRFGIDIARRTVAKYREALGIASSVQRRRQKANLKLIQQQAPSISNETCQHNAGIRPAKPQLITNIT